MAHTVVGKLNKAANQFQAGESVGFGLRVGVKHYDRETKTEKYTNYETAVFAKAPAQVQFYQQALVEGAIVEINGDKLAIKQYQGQNGLSLSIEILNASLGFVSAPQQAAPQQHPMQQPMQQPQQGFQPQYQQPQPQYQQPTGFQQQPNPAYQGR